jgi:UDP-N-acetylmuramoylalanine--D-glutamate ligase
MGLARSGRAAAKLLARGGWRVYASDAGSSPDLSAVADELRPAGIEVDLGGHDHARIAAADLAVVSPGIPPDAPPVAAARAAGVRVVSEIFVALQALSRSRVIAVTGTNGKSTTTALVAHLLTGLGRRTAAAGNIGRALSELALEEEGPEWIALEISSFQLHDTPDFSPLVGVLTNLSPDHLDRYPGVKEYYADKKLLFAGATPASRWVTSCDDAAVQEMTIGVPGRHFTFSTLGVAEAWLDRADGSLWLMGERLCAREELQLFGVHNIANSLAAALAVAAAEDEPLTDQMRAGLREGLASFPGLPHRLERVGEFEGVLWVNDSKATNVDAARMAIQAMDRPAVILMGGRHKGESYRSLARPLSSQAAHVIAYGESASRIESDLAGAGVSVQVLGSDFEEVIAAARRLARPGDVVLLAPACSSFDMFRDFEHRGDTFRALVTAS